MRKAESARMLKRPGGLDEHRSLPHYSCVEHYTKIVVGCMDPNCHVLSQSVGGCEPHSSQA
jgi:hypothetical protein